MNIPFLPLKRTYEEIRRELDSAYQSVMASGWYILGPETDAFEREFASYCGARHCVGVANGLDALTLILRAYGIGEGDEVLVPSNTYIASWLAVSAVGARPVPVEPIAATANIDPERVDAAITPRTRAVMAVHLYGQPADMGQLTALCSRRGLRLIEDAAQAHGARWNGVRTGALGDAAAFSFYPTKNLGCHGDGGAVTTNDPALADRVRLLRNYGSRRKYYNETRGVNSRLDELQAAFLRVKLRHLDAWNAERAKLARLYVEQLADVPGLRLPVVAPGAVPCWHLFTVRTGGRDDLAAHLHERGIETLIHYPVPPHRSEAYKEGGWRADEFPVALRIADEVLSLPMGPHLPASDAATVAHAVREFARMIGRRG